jgi:hypothetical protein
MATAATVNTYVDAANTAMDTEDWNTALRKLLQAKAALSGLPDSKQGNEELRWDRSAIDGLINQVKDQQGATAAAGITGGVQRARVRYARATD